MAGKLNVYLLFMQVYKKYRKSMNRQDAYDWAVHDLRQMGIDIKRRLK